MSHLKQIILIIAACACLAACSNKKQWHIDGKIEGAEGQTLLLEASNNGNWYLIDSIKISDSGTFKSAQDAPGFPDIYRIRLGNKSLYFPIDSIESITLVAKADAFDSDYEFSGSPSADMLMTVDRKVRDYVAHHNADKNYSDSTLKRELTELMLTDPAGIIAYYIINKMVDGAPLFDVTNRKDLRVIGAVANAYTSYRPNDPRTNYLTRLYLTNRARNLAPTDTLVASVADIIDISLYDNGGKRQHLNEVAGKNRVVILNFTAYGTEISPALNNALRTLYNRYHDSGLEIYQVAIDENEVTWRETAKNLPWITVYKPINDNTPLVSYNVGQVPMTYIIAGGELVERITDYTTLEKSLTKRL